MDKKSKNKRRNENNLLLSMALSLVIWFMSQKGQKASLAAKIRGIEETIRDTAEKFKIPPWVVNASPYLFIFFLSLIIDNMYVAAMVAAYKDILAKTDLPVLSIIVGANSILALFGMDMLQRLMVPLLYARLMYDPTKQTKSCEDDDDDAPSQQNNTSNVNDQEAPRDDTPNALD